MPDQKLLSIILDYLVTSLDREVLVEELQSARAKLFDQKKEITQHALAGLPHWLTPRLLESFPELSRSRIDEELQQLIATLRELEVVQLQLSYEPSTQQIWQYLHLCRQHFGNNLVLQISRDSQIIGGVVLTYNGQQIDLSLRTKLQQTHV
jgi:hypothetical protein